MTTAWTSLVDVAYAVCTALDRAGTTAVLTGGSAATFYAPDAYQSADLDFVITFNSRGDSEKALFALGYERRHDFYQHPESPFPLEFPSGPLSVGDDRITRWSTHERGDELLRVLSPTDCCRDRLAAFLHWNDFSSLEQALAVYRTQSLSIDLEIIEDWCTRERQPEKFELFVERIRSDPSQR